VTKGFETLRKLETLPTRKEGIFVMPLERITILATYWYSSTTPTVLRSLAGGGAKEGATTEAGEGGWQAGQ
jgi:hypothetical protein